MKAVKGGKTDDEPGVRHITLRGVAYTIREATVPEYKAALKDATRADGLTPFGDLLETLTMRLVSPSLLAAAKPVPYPVYRTLEGIVNEMHFEDLADEATASTDGEGDGEGGEGEAPNS